MTGATTVPIGRWLDDHSALFSVETITPSQYDDQRQRPLTADQRLWQAVLVDALQCLRFPTFSATYREAWQWFTDTARTDIASWTSVAAVLRIDADAVRARIIARYREPVSERQRRIYLRKPVQGVPFPVVDDTPLPEAPPRNVPGWNMPDNPNRSLRQRPISTLRVREHAGKPAAQRIVAPKGKRRLTVAGRLAG